MKAAVFNEPGSPLQIESVSDPVPGEHEVVVKVHHCGICGSDLHITEGHSFTVPSGTILGHEFTGEVVAVGKAVTRLRVGDRAAAMPIFGCGNCRYCYNGEPGRCLDSRFLFGGFAEYALMNDRTAVKLPNSISSLDGALAEPLAVALHGVAMAGLRPGARVLIQGAGPIGLAALFWVKKLGAGVVDMIEGVTERAEIALIMGADSVSSPLTIETKSGALIQPKFQDAPELVIECVGRPGLLPQAINKVAHGGTIVSLGVCFQPDPITPFFAASKEAKIYFPQLYTEREFELAVDALDRGVAGPHAMITRTVGFDGLPGAFEALRHSSVECKIMLDPKQSASQ